MQAVLEEGKRRVYTRIISRIAGGNDISIHLHRQFDFADIGTDERSRQQIRPACLMFP